MGRGQKPVIADRITDTGLHRARHLRMGAPLGPDKTVNPILGEGLIGSQHGVAEIDIFVAEMADVAPGIVGLVQGLQAFAIRCPCGHKPGLGVVAAVGTGAIAAGDRASPPIRRDPRTAQVSASRGGSIPLAWRNPVLPQASVGDGTLALAKASVGRMRPRAPVCRIAGVSSAVGSLPRQIPSQAQAGQVREPVAMRHILHLQRANRFGGLRKNSQVTLCRISVVWPLAKDTRQRDGCP